MVETLLSRLFPPNPHRQDYAYSFLIQYIPSLQSPTILNIEMEGHFTGSDAEYIDNSASLLIIECTICIRFTIQFNATIALVCLHLMCIAHYIYIRDYIQNFAHTPFKEEREECQSDVSKTHHALALLLFTLDQSVQL